MPKPVLDNKGNWLRPNTSPSWGAENLPMPECGVAEGSTIERMECDPWEGRRVSQCETVMSCFDLETRQRPSVVLEVPTNTVKQVNEISHVNIRK